MLDKIITLNLMNLNQIYIYFLNFIFGKPNKKYFYYLLHINEQFITFHFPFV